MHLPFFIPLSVEWIQTHIANLGDSQEQRLRWKARRYAAESIEVLAAEGMAFDMKRGWGHSQPAIAGTPDFGAFVVCRLLETGSEANVGT